MQMNSKIISLTRNKLKKYLNDKEIIDIILFGSVIKGKSIPNDIDIAIITDKDYKINIPNFHISLIKLKEFFKNPPSLVHTLFREGYSLKNKRFFSENYKFSNKALFKYELSNLEASKKVKIVYILRGKNKDKGLVKENNGEWIANQVFIVPIGNESFFEKFFLKSEVKFRKFYVLIH